MAALVYLYFTKFKASIRNVFSKLSSAIFVICMILLYGFLFIMMLMNGSVSSLYNIKDLSIVIMIGIAYTVFMVGIMLLQSKKALFMENDAFYLFAGPFTRAQAMQYIMSQSILNALMCGALSIFFMVMLGSFVQYSFLFLCITFLMHSLVYFFFTILYYYVYLLSIKDKKYKHVSQFVVAFFVAILLVIVGILAVENHFDMQAVMSQLLVNDIFYAIPLFGWIKMVLVAYIQHDAFLFILGVCLSAACCVIVYILMVRYDGDFVEQAMQDSIEFTARYKEAKAGKRSTMKDKKVRNVKAKDFLEGAGAIFSKNMLLMKKGGSFLGLQDVIFIGIYLAITMFGNLGFVFFTYMMLFWLFLTIPNENFMKEMDHYTIYLIPDKAVKKMWYLLLPSFIKYVVLVGVPILLGGILMHAGIVEMIQNYLLLAGYACLFISSSVLATRVLKSRNNAVLENMLRMLIMMFSAIPSILVIVIVMSLGMDMVTAMGMLSVLTLVMNFIIAAIIIISCSSMMNGREIKSE